MSISVLIEGSARDTRDVPGAVERLASEVALRSAASGNDKGAFSRIAGQVLREQGIHEHVDGDAIIQYVLERPGELDCNVHSPQVVHLCTLGEISIYAHFWAHSFATPHSHNWTGAFQIIQGSSLCFQYEFVPRAEIDYGCVTGSLSMVEAMHLPTGGIQCVDAGQTLIHALWQIEQPTVCISIRSHVEDLRTSRSYWYPGLAIETLPDDAYVNERRKVLDVIAQTRPETYRDHFRTSIRNASLPTVFRLLEHGFQVVRDRSWLRECVLEQEPRLGPETELVFDAAEECLRTVQFIPLRRKVQASDNRFLLGLMCLCTDRETVFRLVRGRWPDRNPVDVMVDWARAMAVPSGDEAPLPMAWNDTILALFRMLVEDRSVEQIARRMGVSPGNEEQLRERCEAMRSLRYFRPLFAR